MLKDSYTIAELEEHRKTWVDALRSGKYKQGEVYLCNHNNYCCLGVACELATPATVVNDSGSKVWDDAITGLNNKIMKYYGIREQYGRYGDATEDSLVYANDFEHKNFLEIADIIEANWNILFTNEHASDYVE